MKIYNKKGFWFGVFWTALSSCNLISSFIRPDSDPFKQITDLCFEGLLILYGTGLLLRAFSKRAAREDFIEARDERNRMIALKTKAMMANFLFGAALLLMVVSIIGYTLTHDTLWIAFFLPPALLFMVYWLGSFFVTLYYENHE